MMNCCSHLEYCHINFDEAASLMQWGEWGMGTWVHGNGLERRSRVINYEDHREMVAIVGVLVGAGDGGVGDSNIVNLFCFFVDTHTTT